MTAGQSGSDTTGLLGPVALSGGLALLLVSPLMRGGNRHAALIALEFIGLAVWVAVCLRALAGHSLRRHGFGGIDYPVLLLALSPLLLAGVQLLPLPPFWWANLAGHAIYSDTLREAGVPAVSWRPISVSPTATATSLLAGIPVAAALLLGYLASLGQLRLILRLVVGVAFGQVALGLLQMAAGEHSLLFFGAASTRPVGTFANGNHYANYLAMSLVAFIWLIHENRTEHRQLSREFLVAARNKVLLSMAGGLVLVLGILISLSRGATVFGLSCAALALAVVLVRGRGLARGWPLALLAATVLLLAAVTIIGIDTATSRASAREWASAASFRATLARTSFEGAMAFWPWGSGWGTYDQVYPRFQPAEISGFANHAHMDYVEMLFEGGIFFAALAATFLWLVVRRAAWLARAARRDRTLDRESMAAALCGLGLLTLLLHSLVEFNMRIPANAILGALLAGVYLRPLASPGPTHDRPSQPHPSRH